MTQTRELPWSYEASKQNIKDLRNLTVRGQTPSLAMAVTQDIWGESGNLIFQTTPQTIRIVSSDANDTAGGSGARRVFIRGLDANFESQNEFVDLNGLTPVTTVNTYIRHFQTIVVEAGSASGTSTPALAGTLTVDWSSTADLAGTIAPTFNGFPQNVTRSSHISVPAGFEGYIVAIDIFANSNNPVAVSLLSRNNANSTSAPFGVTGSYLEGANIETNLNIRFSVPRFVDELTDL